jgi:hypothetical protein
MTSEALLDGTVAEMGGRRFSTPRGSRRRGRLAFTRGAARLTIRSERMPDLFRAGFQGPVPAVSVDGGAVTVRYPRLSPRGWPRPWARRRGQVTLNQDVRWEISVRHGAAHLDADLRDLAVAAVDVGHGASHLDLRLPRPSGVVPVRIGGGASHVRIRRPAGTPAQLHISRGVADLTFDKQEFGAVGGRLRLESPQAGAVEGGYQIEIAGGAAHVQVTTE